MSYETPPSHNQSHFWDLTCIAASPLYDYKPPASPSTGLDVHRFSTWRANYGVQRVPGPNQMLFGVDFPLFNGSLNLNLSRLEDGYGDEGQN